MRSRDILQVPKFQRWTERGGLVSHKTQINRNREKILVVIDWVGHKDIVSEPWEKASNMASKGDGMN